ncbi:transcriptional repressor [Tetragenococcus koreensis]|uniref:Fur family transcriptional regulator n=1 Tax=Tetragenococcus koreensis TaxID=290335 RepID=A0AAN4RKJ6_9ENTE|nr:Fur family transcriptional regulator [Tetragenococcus koreensis]AYW45331.1 transcriptional repressor [Tetragenococcus koreensis]MCF1584705.1 transcriptional repressor [Tetragenococcus koreensis]MCF1614321.1 transcriptional repressor [Tetragenococcus koreensis]MCF1617039.1 transcriptional repressor [Tetragenococcus koreensis]MCF1620067.1 transcriptional repressor [Tetragenococcus koreensis]
MENQTMVKEAVHQMKDYGFKYTKKREAIISYLAQNNRYVAAKELHDFLNQKYSGISYDTIYRNLRDFSTIGILEDTELDGEMKFRFNCSLQGAEHHHHHFICTVCGKTKELTTCPMDFFQDQLPGCTIEDHRFEIFGHCENCQKIA